MTTDETKGTPKDESKGKGTPKDDSKGTPKDKGKLYTVAQIDKFKSDAAAMGQGRAEKAAKQEKEALTQELQSTKSRLDALEAQANEARLAEARGNPELMPIYQREQAVTKRERDADEVARDLTRQQGQLKTDRTDLDKDKGVVNIAYTAAKHGLKVEDLESLGITDQEQLEKVAAKLAAGKDKGEDADRQAYQALETDEEREAFLEAHPDLTKEAAEFKPDSGDGTGQGELTEQQRLDERFPTMKTK